MASARINMRLDQELWGWVAVYAKRRDATRTQIVEAALREFREACEGGVPELEETSSRSEDRGSRGRGDHLAPTPAHASPASSTSPRASVEVPHVASVREMHPVARPAQSEWERTMRARQTRLNKGKG